MLASPRWQYSRGEEMEARHHGPRIIIIGAYGMTNLGDDAILAAMLAELR